MRSRAAVAASGRIDWPSEGRAAHEQWGRRGPVLRGELGPCLS